MATAKFNGRLAFCSGAVKFRIVGQRAHRITKGIMILRIFTILHVLISLLGILSGFVVIYGMHTANPLNGWTEFFLATTVATSVTGFFFPAKRLMPSHIVGIISLVVLAP